MESMTVKPAPSCSLPARDDGTEVYPSMHRGSPASPPVHHGANKERQTLWFILTDELVTAAQRTETGRRPEALPADALLQ